MHRREFLQMTAAVLTGSTLAACGANRLAPAPGEPLPTTLYDPPETSGEFPATPDPFVTAAPVSPDTAKPLTQEAVNVPYQLPEHYTIENDTLTFDPNKLIAFARLHNPDLPQDPNEALAEIDIQGLVSADLEALTISRLPTLMNVITKIMMSGDANPTWAGMEEDTRWDNEYRNLHRQFFTLAHTLGLTQHNNFDQINELFNRDAWGLATAQYLNSYLNGLRMGIGFSPADAAFDGADILSIALRKKDLVGNPAGTAEMLAAATGIVLGGVLDAWSDVSTAERALKSVDNLRVLRVQEGSDAIIYAISPGGSVVRYAPDGSMQLVDHSHVASILERVTAQGKAVVLDLGTGTQFRSLRNVQDTFVITIDRGQNYNYMFRGGAQNMLNFINGQQVSTLLGIQETIRGGFSLQGVSLLQAFFPHRSLARYVSELSQLREVVSTGTHIDLVINGDSIADLLRAQNAPPELVDMTFELFKDGNPLAQSRGGLMFDGITDVAAASTHEKAVWLSRFMRENKAHQTLQGILPHSADYLTFRTMLGQKLQQYFHLGAENVTEDIRMLSSDEVNAIGTTWAKYAAYQDFSLLVRYSPTP